MANKSLSTILGGFFGGAFIVPIFVFGFVTLGSSKGCKASIVANAKLALVLAIIGAIGGLVYGIITAVKEAKAVKEVKNGNQ
jgi:hypothetical protein